MGTIYGEWLQKIIDDALKLRNTKTNEEEKGEFVYMNQDFFDDLKNINFLSSKLICFMIINRKTWQGSILASEEGAFSKNVQREKNFRSIPEASGVACEQSTLAAP